MNMSISTGMAVISPAAVAAPEGTKLTIRVPDDFHHHCRDGDRTAAVLAHTAKRFGRCLIMPNLHPPVVTTEAALTYKEHIIRSLPVGRNSANSCNTMEPLMTLFLTDHTTPDEIKKAAEAGLVGCKYYPAGATTRK
jgi:dihydroorotase